MRIRDWSSDVCSSDLLDFGHDRDVTRGRISDDVADLGLGVEAAIAHGPAIGVDARRSRGLPPRADAGELRVSIDLDPPALVVGEVPMERVELGARHAVDHPLPILDRL